MPRVKTGYKRTQKHKKLLKQAKGFYGSRRKIFKRARETLLKSGEYSFAGRKNNKRNFRKLWIIRINAALKEHNIRYSDFINRLKKNNIELNRKSLSALAQNKNAFKKLVAQVKK
ncbi:50S ribosomal protein L20 [candidate division WWE3 bacterium CG09_land_8_20_14_0_10_39_24]|uniref:Large ribosomal subunit protein bL20 n=2 Tax=Katanobacteria TaxID=422282 RepID=A0A2G9XEE5_UNCKA|nr:MAG: 50S ribosomal protein L20 [bacterium CG2_30_40_12]OJI08390.1 MAG: 50S ribosomal protein L20 [bacterium CG09_39_24]PIP04661.1 MAG: 50S ribosomal protein L20 [candidate division WWE3 bacterium CG23_combo_of_CG06-09_8_20_14_all_40_14]PIS12678.1 MAG: 50S ribosomal protein L20 [candidate division WWE3 bacterium CG09_land_8_20_14_0_10_39_24]PJE50899.1 MAG: 50S ribosomal protein L20 [candidate division WWE3 bacterium CG10_big_fil_rev_8_21_14_0_10_39_14]